MVPSESSADDAPELAPEEQFRERLSKQEPPQEEKDALLAEHEGHLVRQTESQLSETREPQPGVQATFTADIPDTYCFTCDEWVGLSGIELRGTPRSREDAYYLGGKPQAIESAESGTDRTLRDLANALLDRHPYLDSLDDTTSFIESRLTELGPEEVSDGA